MKAKVWLISWLIIVVSALSVFGYWVYKIDPFFHYHKPDTEKYFYVLNNQRSQNDGISKYFEYDTLITGTSMTENFRTTEVDEIFGCNSIKVAYSGGSYKEINDNIKNALKSNPELKTIIRCLDMSGFLLPSDAMRSDLGKYPTYLYDENPFNDVEYLLNKDVVFGRAYQMTLDNDMDGFKGGITTFDEYSRWQSSYSFGVKSVNLANEEYWANFVDEEEGEETHIHLTDEEKEIIKKNIELNVTNLAEEYKNIEFYYFYSPYSVVAWDNWKVEGKFYKILEAEAYITELIIPHKNIHLFSFNNRTDITADLNNYKDAWHYGSWINSLMLRWIRDGKYQLTEDNYQEYLKEEYDFYTTFDYASVNSQIDYEEDYYIAALLNQELTGVEPKDVLNDQETTVFLNDAEYIIEDGKKVGIDCRGYFERDMSEDLVTYLRDKNYIGAKFTIDLDAGYNYLYFEGKKIQDHGRLIAYVYNEEGELVGSREANYTELDNEVHRYVIDLSAVKGEVTIVLHGGYIDNTGSPESNYQFTNIYMY